MASTSYPEGLSHSTYTRAFISLIAIIGVLIFSAMLLQQFQQIGWTEYDLAKAGLFADFDVYGNTISAWAFDSQGQLWVGANDWDKPNISVLTKDETWKTYPLSNSKIPNERVTSLAIDNDNRVWVGTDAGLEVLAPQGTWEKMLDGQVFALATDQQERLWVAIGMGGTVLEQLEAVDQGQPWVGMGNKLSQLSNGKWKDYTPKNSEISELGSVSLIVDQQGQVWMTDGYQIDILKPDGSWTKNVAPNIPDPESLVIDNQNNLWVGTMYGLYICNNGNCARYNARISGLGENLIPPSEVFGFALEVYGLGKGGEYEGPNGVYDLAFDNKNKLWMKTTAYNRMNSDILILDIDRALPASLLQVLFVLQWLENITLFVLAYHFVIRQLSRKNNLLIGALGGGLVQLIASVSLAPLSLFTIIVTLIGAVIGLIAGALGGKITDERIVYVVGGLTSIFMFYFYMVFSLSLPQ